MLFDRLAYAVERMPSLKPLFPMMSRSRLFTLDRDFLIEETRPKSQVVRGLDTFFLPFRTVAVEDRQKVVVLEDLAEDIRGLNSPRRYLACVDVEALVAFKRRELGIPLSASERGSQQGRSPRLVVEGLIRRAELVDSGDNVNLAYTVQNCWYTDEVLPDAIALDNDIVGEAISSILWSAYNEVGIVNTPNRFVVESVPLKSRDAKRGRILRSHQRPTYTILEPGRIRKIMRLPQSVEVGSAKRPHERRRHVRHLVSERYQDMRGEYIIIPATWIGPSESVVGSRRYKVILD